MHLLLFCFLWAESVRPLASRLPSVRCDSSADQQDRIAWADSHILFGNCLTADCLIAHDVAYSEIACYGRLQYLMSDRPDHRPWNSIEVEFECPETVAERNLFDKTRMVEISGKRFRAHSRFSTTVGSRQCLGV